MVLPVQYIAFNPTFQKEKKGLNLKYFSYSLHFSFEFLRAWIDEEGIDQFFHQNDKWREICEERMNEGLMNESKGGASKQ